MSKVLGIGHKISQWVFRALIGLVLAYVVIGVGHAALDAGDAHGHVRRPIAACPEEDSCDYSGILNRWVPVLH